MNNKILGIVTSVLAIAGIFAGVISGYAQLQNKSEQNKEKVEEVKKEVKEVRIDVNELDAISREQAIMHQMTMEKFEQHGKIMDQQMKFMEKMYDKLAK